jgi:hypothetical protein
VPETTASSHLGAYIREVIAKYEGGDLQATAANDQMQLEMRHTSLVKKRRMIEDTIGTHEETKRRLNKLLKGRLFSKADSMRTTLSAETKNSKKVSVPGASSDMLQNI